LAAAARVGVAFDDDLLLGVVREELCVHFDDGTIFFLDGVAVKVEKHRTLLRERALRIERIPLACRTVACSTCAGTVGAASAGAGGRVVIQLHRAAAGGQSSGKANHCKASE